MENGIEMDTTAGPELDYITVKGFRSIASIERLELRPVNLIIGPNGSGKSNFIGVFSFLNAIRQGHLNDYMRKSGGAELLLHFGSKTTEEIYFLISFHQQGNQYELTLKPTADDSLYPAREWVGNARQRDRRGGIRAWPAVRDDIIRHLREDPGCVETTLIDYYGQAQTGARAWPGRESAIGKPGRDGFYD